MHKINDRMDWKFKEKTIHDLARFIGTRAENVANYTLLLGAGCSITSGIRSATELIKEWKSEIIGPMTGSDNPSQDDIDHYLINNQPPWYDKSKEYSSLFERRFDLQPQRRIFVENEVSNKKPSIGYAYLTALVNQNYLNTIFTTNFDDLLNEAFFQFSDLRPIICAHDSSINGVTVTSKRPKIVKLHGDYLFDDIKTTTRETESLEQNMRLKFSEFAKDSGLIVVGYAGNDRSIMDVLSSLLRNEDYFKKGIYWCLRSDSHISEDLRKLLWRDRVYPVNVDGFDEMFAELFAKFNNGDVIPISTRKVSTRNHEIIKSLIIGKNLETSSSSILRKAHESLTKESKTDALYELMKKSNDDNFTTHDKLNDEELLTIFEASNLIKEEKYSLAIETCRLKFPSVRKTEGKAAFLRTIKSAYALMGDHAGAISAINETISYQPYFAQHHLSKLTFVSSKTEKQKIIDSARLANPHSEHVYLEEASLILEDYDEYSKAGKEESLKKALGLLDIGIEKDPSFSNPCWLEKFTLIHTHREPKSAQDELQKIISLLSKQNPRNLTVLKMRGLILHSESPNEDADSFFSDINESIARRLDDFNQELQLIKLKALSQLDRIAELRIAISSKAEELNSFPVYATGVAKIEREKFCNDEESAKILKNVIEHHKDMNALPDFIQVLLDLNKAQEAERYFSKYALRLTLNTRTRLKSNLLAKNKNYDDAIRELETAGKHSSEMLHNIAYLQILNGSYKVAENTIRARLEKVSFSLDSDVDLINLEVAKKNQGEKINEMRLKQLIDFSKSSATKVAAYALLKNREKLVEHLRLALRKDQSMRFSIRDWPVMTGFLDDKNVSLLLKDGVPHENKPQPILQQVVSKTA